MAVEIVNTCPSPAVAPTRTSVRHSFTPQVKMPCMHGISDKTPDRGSIMENLPSEFVECCVNCDGTYPSMKYDPFARLVDYYPSTDPMQGPIVRQPAGRTYVGHEVARPARR